MRRQRGKGDYMASEGAINPDDVLADLPAAAAIVEAAVERGTVRFGGPAPCFM